MQQWNIAEHALASADRHYAETLALPDLSSLTSTLLRPRSTNLSESAATAWALYAEMLRELQDLLREIRFLTGTGLMLIFDATEERRRHAESFDRPDIPGLFITESEIAALLVNDDFHRPSTLATDRHRHVGDGETLGSWFGGTLLDIALTKCHGALDRLVTALWCHAELPIRESKRGQIYPNFTRENLKELGKAYDADPSWEKFFALIDTTVAQELTRFRHDGTHKRRAGSALNGGRERWQADMVNTEQARHRVTRGMTVVEHANAPLVTYRELLVPAMTIAVELISRRSASEASAED